MLWGLRVWGVGLLAKALQRVCSVSHSLLQLHLASLGVSAGWGFRRALFYDDMSEHPGIMPGHNILNTLSEAL